MNRPIIVITGPTASGKTSLAIMLAKKFSGEIINADSRSVYREMDIATGKPTEKELKTVSHHLVDFLNPDTPFSLADYKKLTDEMILSIQGRKKVPFLVGGTGLYVDAVIYDFSLAETSPDHKLRKKLELLSADKLLADLQKIDPETYQIIDKSNKRRLIRAVEVATKSHESFTKLQKKKALPQNVLYLVLDVPREVLYKKIDSRIDSWLSDGLVEETKRLVAKYPLALSSMSSIGYQEIAQFLDEKLTLEEAIITMKKRTRHYAKRQVTWFKRNKDAIWVKNEKEAEKLINDFLK